ncbi:MAG TPA: hypothetical protein VH164_14585 [Ktedonobacteraceae bacterium]|nr:hypothetical protein [Ktedonobacteraceae bacterium]
MEKIEIQWANSDIPGPERLEALAAARDIITLLGVSVGEVMVNAVADRVQVVAGAAERTAYNLGWKHCSDAIRE